jgi:hypothetical protein
VTKRYCLLAALCMLLLPVSSTAQVPIGPGRISGLVKSTEGGLPTVAATLSSAADSALVTGVQTDAAGRFRIEGLQPGRYLLRVSTLGYRPRGSEVLELSLAEPHIDLGAARSNWKSRRWSWTPSRRLRSASASSSGRTARRTT